MLKIRIEIDDKDKALYNLIYSIYHVGGFNMNLENDKLLIEITTENSVKARQIINSILRLIDTAERTNHILKNYMFKE